MPSPMPVRAFTVRYSSRQNVLRTNVGLAEAFDGNSGKHKEYNDFVAIWDTGASRTVISKNLVERLGLIQIDRRKTQTANGSRIAGIYLVNIRLPNKVAIEGIAVLDGDIHRCDVLIGMDIIGMGDFAVTCKSEKTVLTFQIPSTRSTDYVSQIKNPND